MTLRNRKLVGILFLVPFIIVYMLLAMLLGSVLINDKGAAAQLIYYLFAGLLWIAPAMLIIRWMGRPDQPTSTS